jgi:hypothetical protein
LTAFALKSAGGFQALRTDIAKGKDHLTAGIVADGDPGGRHGACRSAGDGQGGGERQKSALHPAAPTK